MDTTSVAETTTTRIAWHTSTAPAIPGQMRAMVQRGYGQPEVLKLAVVDVPVPGDDEVLVRVHAAGVSIGDHHVVTGMPYVIRLSPHAGLLRPRRATPGMALAGRVMAAGANVTTVRPGDEVFGDTAAGAFAEYALVPAGRLAPKPANVTFEEAAAMPWAVAPLQALRDAGGLQAGQRVLINGASGGVGTWAVQIAKALGAHVTAVCSSRNAQMVLGLGAGRRRRLHDRGFRRRRRAIRSRLRHGRQPPTRRFQKGAQAEGHVRVVQRGKLVVEVAGGTCRDVP
jgi:NADPH:quinone reductase-like Zn-dependent oxidoreductase